MTPREAFESQLDAGAKRIFDGLPENEKDRIIAIRLPPTVTGSEEEIATLDGIIYNHLIEGGLYADAIEVETFGLVDVILSRGWVRYKNTYAPPKRVESWKRQDAQDEADARDLALGRNFGASLARIEAQGAELKKDVGETRQGVAALVQNLPDAKKPTVIEWDEAVAIMKAKGGDPTWSARTGRNWIKAGKAAKTGTPISWDDLATTASWSVWVDAYLAALKSKLSKKRIISERKAQAEAAENRRRGRIA